MPKRAKPVDLQGLLDAVLPHVAFDGWSDAALKAGATDLGADEQTIGMGGVQVAHDVRQLARCELGGGLSQARRRPNGGHDGRSRSGGDAL